MELFSRRTGSSALGWVLAAVVAAVVAAGCATGAPGSGGQGDGTGAPGGGGLAGPDAAVRPGGGGEQGPDAGGRGGTPDAGGGPARTPLLNEFVANHTGTDECEYVELFGTPGADYSGYAILEVEGDGAGAGLVEEVYTPGIANRDGLWVTPMLTSELQNGTMTLLVVAGFSGAVNDDLDSDDDGTLDATPWSALVDAVAVTDGGASDRTYAGAALLTSGYDGVGGEPGGASRIPDGSDTDAPGDWVRNDEGGQGLSCDPGATAPSGRALNTPGMLNAVQL